MIIMSKVTTYRFRFKFSSWAEICRHLAFRVLPVIIELAKNSQKSLMRWRGQLVIIAITRKYISCPFMKSKSTSLLRLASRRVLAKNGLALIAHASNWYSWKLKHLYIFKYNLLGFLGVLFLAPSSAELAAGGDKNAFKSIQVGSNWLKLRF